MNQDLTTKTFSRTSLRTSRSARTVLLRMAADEARGQRIYELYKNRADLKWGAIAAYCGVEERTVHNWASGKGMKPENAQKLAELFKVSFDYVWWGPDGPPEKLETPDVLEALNPSEAQELRKQLNRIEEKLDKLLKPPTAPRRRPPPKPRQRKP